MKTLATFQNVKQSVRAGVGIELLHKDLSVGSLKFALRTILEDSSYRKNARRRSELFRDQPEMPLSRAVFWINWMVRHKDEIDVIKLPINSLGWFAVNSYDIVLFSVVLLVFVIAVVTFPFWKIYKHYSQKKVRKFDAKVE